MTGVMGWAYKKYRTVRHAAHGTFNRVAKVGAPPQLAWALASPLSLDLCRETGVARSFSCTLDLVSLFVSLVEMMLTDAKLQFVLQINGKKLHPARGVFGAFLLPLLAWWIVALVIFGVSFQKVAMLQAPLTSLQVGDKHCWGRTYIRLRSCAPSGLPGEYQ
jgi:hypothetical protein